MPLLTPLFKVIDLVRQESTPLQIGFGVVIGMYLGLTPPLTLQYAVFWTLLLLLRVNILAAAVSLLFFWGLGQLSSPLFAWVGNFILTGMPSLYRLWAWLYHSPILPYTRFNHTGVMGSSLFCLILTIPLFLLCQKLIVQYRTRFFYRITESRFARSWKQSELHRLYENSQHTHFK